MLPPCCWIGREGTQGALDWVVDLGLRHLPPHDLSPRPREPPAAIQQPRQPPLPRPHAEPRARWGHPALAPCPQPRSTGRPQGGGQQDGVGDLPHPAPGHQGTGCRDLGGSCHWVRGIGVWGWCSGAVLGFGGPGAMQRGTGAVGGAGAMRGDRAGLYQASGTGGHAAGQGRARAQGPG